MNTRITHFCTYLFILLGLALSSVSPAFASSLSVPLNLTTVTGYKLPFPAGENYPVSGSPVYHSNLKGYPRGAIDFGMEFGKSVVAMKAGDIAVAQTNAAGGGHMVIVDTRDGYCSVYLHLSSITRSSGAVKRGEEVGKSGKGGPKNVAHLHVAVTSKGSSGCGEYILRQEVTLIFDEIGREVTPDDANQHRRFTSQNTLDGGNEYVPPTRFVGNPSSRLFIDQNGQRANLTVCADNLPGNTVNVFFWRNGRDWSYSQLASDRCVTFWDMDGSGPVLWNYTYYSMASLNRWPDRSWPIPCYNATNGEGLCDSVRRR